MPSARSDIDIPALLREGLAALTQGRADAAATICRQMLGADPRCVPAHFLVGLVALERRDHKTAVSAFGSVTHLSPKHAAAWAQLARVLMQLGRPNEAEPALARALEIGSDDPLVQDLLGTVCALFGDHLVAQQWFDRATTARPDVAAFQINRANNLISLGHDVEARSALAAVLLADPDSPQGHWMLANARRATSSDHIVKLDALCVAHAARPHAMAFLAYAAGKEHEDLEQWSDAFAAFVCGATAKRATVDYDEGADAALFDAITATFTPDWCARAMPACVDPSPIFVIGQPRTGTTLIERIITSHSQVHSAGELQQFPMSVRRMANVAGPQRHSVAVMRAAATIDPRTLGEMYLHATTHLRGTKTRFVDKLPINYLYLALIAKALPNARIVHVVRGPIDSCFASYKQLFADAYLHSYDLAEMARHHIRYRHLMDHWRAVLPGRFIDVAYEDVVDDVEREARRLIEYLGLPWEDACLEFHRNSASVSTASAVQVREPVHRRSVARWRRYEVQLQPMISALREAGLN